MNSKSLAIVALLLFVFCSNSFAQLDIQAIDVAGDSISKGFNAQSSSPCTNGDQETYNWITSNTGQTNCSVGTEGVYSVLERLKCSQGTNIIGGNPNSARSGAQMLSDFLTQSNNIKTFLTNQNSPRLAAVFLGHNDTCGGTIAKTNASCSSPDQDPNNYCRTKPGSFEREFRKGLDVLLTVSNTRIGVLAPVRVSQLRNFSSKSNCQLGGSCSLLWSLSNICGSVTRDCSDTRIIDGYNSTKAFRDILKSVSAEYAAIPEGGMSPVVIVGGEMVGGSTKAAGTNVVYSDAPWNYRFSSNQLSCCDCFHPSALGQDKLGELITNGMTCSVLTPCCRDTGNPLIDGKCQRREVKRVHYKGIF